MSKPTLHLLGIFHTIHNQAFSHCAFTGKALRFSKMMKPYGYNIVEYANEGSESEADEKVVMLLKSQYDEYIGNRDKKAFHGDVAAIGTKHHQIFEAKLVAEMKKRVKPQDLICHPFGHAHSRLLGDFPKNIHIETGIGYPTLVKGTMRIFESEAWRHYHCAKEDRQGTNYEWVIPNYFDIDDWAPSYEPGKYLAFLGRISSCKGLDTLLEVAKYADKKIILCGQGDPTPWKHPNIEYWGPLTGTQRSEFMRNAICSLMPTNFLEPFGGSGVEGMLCGTPLVSTDYGAFTETVVPGLTGYRCKTLRDWLDAIEQVGDLDRKKVAAHARHKYSLQTCGAMYDKAFTHIHELYSEGWYTLPDTYKRRKIECVSGSNPG
jgi:glycosyltransferase involved in cell wall biosynthesis